MAARLAAGERARTRVQALTAEIAGLRAEKDQLGERLRAAVGAEAEARKEFERADADLTVLRKTLAREAGGHDSVAARQRALSTDADASGLLAGALDRLAGAISAERTARDRARAEALASGFDCLEAARSAVLTPAQQAALNDLVADWSRRLVALQANAGAAELAGLDPRRAGAIEAAAERAAAGLAQARAAEQRARATRDGHVVRAGRLERRLAEVRAAEQAAASLATETEPVIYLAGLAKGMEGHRRVALTTYVLRHWFEQVVAAANVRLAIDVRRPLRAEAQR